MFDMCKLLLHQLPFLEPNVQLWSVERLVRPQKVNIRVQTPLLILLSLNPLGLQFKVENPK